jgi:hypothetical protein
MKKSSAPNNFESFFLEKAKIYREKLSAFAKHNLMMVGKSDISPQNIEATSLGGMAIHIASWRDFKVYIFLDNEQNTQQSHVDGKSNFWFGFYHSSKNDFVKLINTLPHSLSPEEYYPNKRVVSNDPAYSKDIDVNKMSRRLVEHYHGEHYYGIWDLNGFIGSNSNVDIDRGVKFVSEIILSQEQS